MLSHYLNQPRSWILAHPEHLLTDSEERALDEQCTLLSTGVPLPYITQHQEFYGLDFIVSPDVLIPRPETEIIIEEALLFANTQTQRTSILDIGTGSGCIPVSLAARNNSLDIVATDLSRLALKIAQKNAIRHRVEKSIKFIQCHLSNVVIDRFDIICANLPYIPQEKLSGLAVSKYEPSLALNGGKDGLFLIKQLLQKLPDQLKSKGIALLEFEESQGEQILNEACNFFSLQQLQIIYDYSDKPRILKIKNHGN